MCFPRGVGSLLAMVFFFWMPLRFCSFTLHTRLAHLWVPSPCRLRCGTPSPPVVLLVNGRTRKKNLRACLPEVWPRPSCWKRISPRKRELVWQHPHGRTLHLCRQHPTQRKIAFVRIWIQPSPPTHIRLKISASRPNFKSYLRSQITKASWWV